MHATHSGTHTQGELLHSFSLWAKPQRRIAGYPPLSQDKTHHPKRHDAGLMNKATSDSRIQHLGLNASLGHGKGQQNRRRTPAHNIALVTPTPLHRPHHPIEQPLSLQGSRHTHRSTPREGRATEGRPDPNAVANPSTRTRLNALDGITRYSMERLPDLLTSERNL